MGCQMIAEALEKNTAVRSLLLGTDSIGDQGAAAIARLVENNAALEVVYLGCNGIGFEGMAHITRAVAQSKTVAGLWLKRNPIGPRGGEQIAEMLRCNRSLRTLDLVNTGLDSEGIHAVVQALTQDNRTVERLYLGGNQIGPKEVQYLAELLRVNPTLKALLLNVNRIGDEGADLLAEALRANQTLQELGLASNDISYAGAIPLLEAVQDHPTLTTLDMGYSRSTRVLGAFPNRISDEGAAIVGKLLAKNPPLCRLDLRGNGITEQGRGNILAGLHQNTHLGYLFLDGKADLRIDALLTHNRASAPQRMQQADDVALIKSVYRTSVEIRGSP